MPFVIRHKESGEIVKMRSGKSVWATTAHAKASFKTSGLDHKDRARFGYAPNGSRFGHGRDAWKFDSQTMFEIVEAKLEQSDDLKRAIQLIEDMLDIEKPLVETTVAAYNFLQEVK
jgi:hypothetical protein